MQTPRSDSDYRAVIFDMDGVIVNSEPIHERAFLEVVSKIGYHDRHGLRFADYVGRRDQDLWLDFMAKHRSPHSLDKLLAMKRKHVLKIMRRERPLFPGLPGLVERLANRVPLALASGSEREVVEEVLNLGNLRRFFPVTVSASDAQRGKPAPDIFLRAAELLGLEPCDCWAIEDSKPGVTAALAANMRVIAITNTHPAQELRHATRTVTTYAEIERRLLPESAFAIAS